MAPPPPHRASTAHLQGAYPLTGAPPSPAGPLLGRDQHGRPWCFDPWERYAAGEVTGPNVVVLGQIGRGKSTMVKLLLWREVALGRRAWVIDPKGEYQALAAATGGTCLRLAPGGAARLNPLDVGRSDRRRAGELLAAVAASSLGRPLAPPERGALDVAVDAAWSGRHVPPTLPEVVAALLEPGPAAAAALRTDRRGVAADGRQVALELRRLVEGDLAGMFDGPTTAVAAPGTPVVVLDLSALSGSPALGLTMVCATAFLHGAAGPTPGGGAGRLVVVDEAWAVLQDLATARWLRTGFKLARALGVAHVAVLHRTSDLAAAGPAGSEQRQLAEGLLADAETTVVFAQPPSEVAAVAAAVGLGPVEAQALTRLPRGVALWKVGASATVVTHLLGPGDGALVDTDAAMRLAPAGAPAPAGGGGRAGR